MEKLQKKPQKNIASLVRDFAEPIAKSQGVNLWDVEYLKEGTEMVLRITIDKGDGISIDDCEKFHREIGSLLDEKDPIENSYRLEVSSPGVERVLKTNEHIDACIGWNVEIKLFAPLDDGKKVLNGILLGQNDDGIGIKTTEGDFTINRSSVAKIQTVYDWSKDMKNE